MEGQHGGGMGTGILFLPFSGQVRRGKRWWRRRCNLKFDQNGRSWPVLRACQEIQLPGRGLVLTASFKKGWGEVAQGLGTGTEPAAAEGRGDAGSALGCWRHGPHPGATAACAEPSPAARYGGFPTAPGLQTSI